MATRHLHALLCALFVGGLAAATPAARPGQPPAAFPDDRFEQSIRPVLLRRCVACHGADAQNGGLRLDRPISPDTARKVAAAVRYDGALKMPPAGKLPAKEIAALDTWIRSGAPWPKTAPAASPAAPTETWAYRPMRPAPKDASVDTFVAQKRRAAGLTMAPPADRRTLIRRLCFDLTGLPPTPDEVAAFLADKKPGAYERVVDRLLASPAYGERWARHWLDLVRYADTNGYERDAEKPFAWKYRDWVIQALNDDKPYDRFVTEQLAGDEMPDRTAQTVVATGFLRLGTWDDEPNDAREYQYERIDDLVHATSTAFLGLTVRCARCHDHKYDPIPQRDYYALAAAFWAGYAAPGDGKLQGGPPPEAIGYPDILGYTDRSPDAAPLHLLAGGDPHREGPVVEAGFLSALPGPSRPLPSPPPERRTTGRRLRLAAWIVDPANPLPARVAVNRVWQHHFGTGLVATPDNLGVKGDPPTHPELLDWLADTFRKPVADGGFGWRLKPLHRLIVLSKTYRQASLHPQPATGNRTDPQNTLLWRFPRRRLDADALRDAILAVDGRLDRRAGGPGFVPTVTRQALEGLSRKGAEWVPSAPDQQNRRTVYLFLKRALIPPLLTTFDFGDTTAPLAQRDTTTVAPQALALMNNPWLHEQGDAFARRVRAQVGNDRERQIVQAWRLALGRSPSAAERAAARAYLERAPGTPPLPVAAPAIAPTGLRLWLRADQGVDSDPDGRVRRWRDQSGEGFDALAAPAGNLTLGQGAVRFDGAGAFLTIPHAVLTSPQFTVLAAVTDLGGPSHREIFSNWNGAAGNAGTSVFLGTTGSGVVRFTDAFAPGGVLTHPDRLHLLTAVSDTDGVAVWQDRREIARGAAPLPPRNLAPPYVVGQQGNIQGEYWNGDIVELLVWNRALSPAEREAAWDALAARHKVAPRPAPADTALASLCRILFNTNEFLTID